MKKLIVLASLLLSQVSWGVTCYTASESTYDYVPKELCFDFVYLDINREEVILRETNGMLPTVLYPHYVARRNENGYRFIAKHRYIVIEAHTDNDGYVEVSHLKVKAELTHGEVPYQLKRP